MNMPLTDREIILKEGDDALNEYMEAATKWSANPTDEGYELVLGLREKWIKLLESTKAKLKALDDFEDEVMDIDDIPDEITTMTEEQIQQIVTSNASYEKQRKNIQEQLDDLRAAKIQNANELSKEDIESINNRIKELEIDKRNLDVASDDLAFEDPPQEEQTILYF